MTPAANHIWKFNDGHDISHLKGSPFTDPFRYIPDKSVLEAARQLITGTDMTAFEEGKMLGILIVEDPSEGTYGFLAAFSGTVKGADGQTTATVPGFVPPIMDITDPGGYFRQKEAEISALNRKIKELEGSPELDSLRSSLARLLSDRDASLEAAQTRLRISKHEREKVRSRTKDPEVLSRLIRESQFQKAELKRLKDGWNSRISELKAEIELREKDILELKATRSEMSDSLQKWIFEKTAVHNGRGESCCIWDIFAHEGLIPPGGTGDCAAPKLLEYAYRNGLRPLAMGEFWYGKPSQTAVRLQGHFYPSCTSKCGPLLGYMLKGLTVGPGQQTGCCESGLPPHIIYSDEAIIVVEKPSGMPSVPGLDGRKSLQDWLADEFPQSQIHQVHRLDMDTSGVMVFARTEAAAAGLRAQFENRTVRKTYKARISPPCCSTEETVLSPRPQGEGPGPKEREGLFPACCSTRKSGVVELPLMADYDERPRQKVDFKQGKPAHTEYQIISNNPDGTSDLLLHPVTGRTHQLRVHCAHALGIGRPILGDLLYGGFRTDKKEGRNADRLCLHALSISFLHPVSGTPMHFTSERATFSQEV